MIPDSAIEYIERLMDVKLFDYQKEMLKLLLIQNEKMWYNVVSRRWVYIDDSIIKTE